MTVTVWLVAGDSMSSYPAPLSLWGWQDLGAVGVCVDPCEAGSCSHLGKGGSGMCA